MKIDFDLILFGIAAACVLCVAIWELERQPPTPKSKEIMINAASLERLTPQCIEGTIKHLETTCWVICEIPDEEDNNRDSGGGSTRTLDHEVGNVDGNARRKTQSRKDI